jgi:hypothetical protein
MDDYFLEKLVLTSCGPKPVAYSDSTMEPKKTLTNGTQSVTIRAA